MKKIISRILACTLLTTTISVGVPQLSGKAYATTTFTQNHTFEVDDPNFGKFADDTLLTAQNLPTMTAVETVTPTGGIKTNVFDTKIVKDTNGNRALQVTVPADKQGKTRFYYGANAGVQTTGNCFTFEGSITFDNQAKEFDLKVIPGDWKANMPIIKFLTTGDIQVRTQTGTTTTYTKRGTWAANTKYDVKLVLYKDINKYDFFITSAGKTTMLAGGEASGTYVDGTITRNLVDTGVAYYNMEAVGTTSTTSTSITYDNVKLGYSNDERNVYVPASDTKVIRTTTFETNDDDATIAATATGAAIATNTLGNNLTSKLRIVDSPTTTGRALEMTTLKDSLGDLYFPTDNVNWNSTAATASKSYTLETDYTMQDKNTDYYLDIVNGDWSLKSSLVLIGKDGKIYARSNSTDNTGNSSMSARTTWTVGKPFTLKLVVHIDTQSYDLYHVCDGVSTRLVNSEPMQASTLYTTGIASFKFYAKAATHDQSVVIIDNSRVSTSNTAGTAPIINAAPGAGYDNSVVIGIPVNYYVSPTGSDSNDGKSPTTPFLSPQKAADLTMPGDTVYFMGGTYTSTGESILNITKPGASTAYITYKPYNNEQPVFRLDKGWNVVNINASYIIFDGIKIQGNAKNVTLAQAQAIYDYYIDYVDRGQAAGETLNRDYISQSNTNGISYNGTYTAPVHHITIRNCEVADMPAAGIGGAKGDYITIENNNIHDNCIWDMYATSGISVLGSIDTDNNTSDYKIVIRNNISSGNISHIKWSATGIRRMSDSNGCILDYNDNSDANSKAAGVKAYAGRFLVANNVFAENGGSGVHAFESSNVDVINNTIYNNNQNPDLKSYSNMFSSNGANNRFLNNIVYAGGTDLITKAPEGASVIFANNLYYGSKAPAYMGKNDKFADPKFVNLAAKDFHLTADSPAIDQGTQTIAPTTDIEKNARPRGAGYDIGAYESAFTSATPLVNNTLDLAAMAASTFSYGDAEAVKGTPVLDGDVDAMWSRATKFSPEKYVLGNLNNIYASADVKLMWDDKNLYVLAVVKDPVLCDKGTAPYLIDSVEAFLDQNNAKTIAYDAAPDDGQYRVDYENKKSGSSWITDSSFTSATKITADGYNVEMAIPFAAATPPSVGKVVGFDFQINDADATGNRQAIKTWADPLGKGYSNTSRWGNVTLVDAPVKSGDATLSGITIDGNELNGFTTDKTEYNVELPVGTTKGPEIAATVTATGKANAVVTAATALPGASTILVTAEDGTTKIYTINFTVKVPEPVKSSDATLSGITIDGNTLNGFTTDKTEYNVELPVGTTKGPEIAATVTVTGKANAVVTAATALPGASTILVTAEDGTTKIYTINFTVKVPEPVKSSDATLSEITIDGNALDGFTADKTEYSVELPVGTTKGPEIAATVTATGKANAVVTAAAALPGASTILVTAEDGTTKIYTINFTVKKTLNYGNGDNIDPSTIVKAIENAPDKSKIIIDVSGNKVVRKEVFDSIKGTDKILIFEQNGVQWIFNGKDIKEDTKDIDMTVNVAKLANSTAPCRAEIANKVKNLDVMIVSFAENGLLPGKASVRIKLDSSWLSGKDQNNLYVYYYNPSSKNIELIDKKLKVDAEGYVEFEITHNSDYFIADKDLNQTLGLPKTGSMIDINVLVGLGGLLLIVGIGMQVFRLKKRSK